MQKNELSPTSMRQMVLEIFHFKVRNLGKMDKFQTLNLQNKFQMIKLFSHSFYTITGKYHEQSAILLISVNLAVLRIAIVVRIPASGNRKNPRFLRFLGQVGTRLYKGVRIPDSYDS